MFSKLSRFAPQVLGGTRILVGILLACHGAQKLLGAFGGIPAGVPGFIVWIAGPIELFGGALLTLGLLTRPTAFLTSGLMAFAYFMSHAPRGFFPLLNNGDTAILYCFVFLYLWVAGGGSWSLDRLRASEPAAYASRV